MRQTSWKRPQVLDKERPFTMPSLKNAIITAGFETLWMTRFHKLFASISNRSGIIFTLHRFSPEPQPPFSPNRLLTVTPQFLAEAIDSVREQGLTTLPLDEAMERVANGFTDEPFAVFTIDDGYLDNVLHGLPVFKEKNCPFTLYTCSGLMDENVVLWWIVLEEVIATQSHVVCTLNGIERQWDTETPAQKITCYENIYWAIRGASLNEHYGTIDALATRYGVDPFQICAAQAMSWDQLRALHAEPLATIGTHTAKHYPLAKLSDTACRDEIEHGRTRLSEELGGEFSHFSYPYGDLKSAGPREYALASELGFKSAVTTIPQILGKLDAVDPHALPRVSLNGLYQDRRYVDVMLSGAPFALKDGISDLVKTVRGYKRAS